MITCWIMEIKIIYKKKKKLHDADDAKAIATIPRVFSENSRAKN